MAKKISKAAGTSPAQILAKDLTQLRRVFGATLLSYQTRVESQIDSTKQAVLDGDGNEKTPQERIRDLRDMLALVRKLEIKSAKGRRRDLRKIENTAGELCEFVGRWNL